MNCASWTNVVNNRTTTILQQHRNTLRLHDPSYTRNITLTLITTEISDRKRNMSQPHEKFQVIMAPNPYTKTKSTATVFLSGSIDTPPTTWQSILSTHLSRFPIQILNPHREDWESILPESSTNPKFVEQTNWELQGMEDADIIAVFFGKNAKAPISMMEMGLWVREGRRGDGMKVVVCCQPGFWKEGNVRVLCERYEITVVESVEALGEAVVGLLGVKASLEIQKQERKGVVMGSALD